MRLIDADALADKLEQIISDYTSHGMYPAAFDIRYATEMVEDMPTLTPPNEWVSVDDRLPEEDPHIKKFIEDEIFGLLTVLVYNGEVKQTNRFFCNAPKFGFSKTDGWEWASSNVTHWMPLPEAPDSLPPEGEEDT